jgi:hypothetical protein
MFSKRLSCSIILATVSLAAAEERFGSANVSVAKEHHVPQTVQTKPASVKQADHAMVHTETDSNYKSFTGKIVGGNVRMRLSSDVESPIVKELLRNDLVVVRGEKSDFYAVEAPQDMKVYIFRSFVLDNVVEGNRVHVRLSPELTAPVVAVMNTGEKVNGTISDKNHKWLEISPPKNVRFYIAKEYIEKIGGPELKALRDKKQSSVIQLMDSAELLSQSEMMKPFEEIDFERVSNSFMTITKDYSDFPEYSEKAKSKLAHLQEIYLQKKIAYLEAKTSKMSKERALRNDLVQVSDASEENLSPRERMKIWERVEESLYLNWSASHHKKTMDDFYEDQKMKTVRISGIVEAYNDVVKNKPGNFVLRDRDMPRAYLYSTFIDLQNYVGKYVTLVAVARPNNNFAFPAYFIFEAEK